MKVTREEVDKIVSMYMEIKREDEESARDWRMDDDNTGFSYEYLSHEYICAIVALKISKQETK